MAKSSNYYKRFNKKKNNNSTKKKVEAKTKELPEKDVNKNNVVKTTTTKKPTTSKKNNKNKQKNTNKKVEKANDHLDVLDVSKIIDELKEYQAEFDAIEPEVEKKEEVVENTDTIEVNLEELDVVVEDEKEEITEEKTEENKQEPKEKVEVVEEEKKETIKVSKPAKKSSTKLMIFMLDFAICIFGAVILGKGSISFEEEKNFNYKETSNVDYNVCLKEDEENAQQCLDSATESYDANLIDNIPVYFNYDFEIGEISNVDFTYSIVSKIIVIDNGETKFEQEYTELEPKTVSMKNSRSMHIDDAVAIDYVDYNLIANSFKNQYGENATSELEVYLKIEKNNKNDDYELDKSKETSIILPLTEEETSINISTKELSDSKNIFIDSNIVVENKTYFIITVILSIIALISLIQIILLVL